MTISLYTASIPNFLRYLDILKTILQKGEADAETRKIDPAVFLQARLAPDMLPLIRHVQIATDIAKACPARLSGTAVASFPDTETTFAELYARIDRVKDVLQSFKPEQIDGNENRAVTFPRRNGPDWSFNGLDYLNNFVTPNVYFHVTTVYAILRHNGVQLGKADYLGL